MEVRYHEWVEFDDANGHGHCEPEAFVVREDELLLVEVKLTGCLKGHAQMLDLYAPLLAHIFGKPVRCLQICKSVSASTPGPFLDDPNDFLNDPTIKIATWHWPGR